MLVGFFLRSMDVALHHIAKERRERVTPDSEMRLHQYIVVMQVTQ